MLRAHIVSASNLPNIKSSGKSEPYVTAIFQGVKNKTSVKKGEINPAWDEKLEWELTGKPPSPDEKLEFLIKNHGKASKNKLLGKTGIQLQDVMSNGQSPQELELPLVDGNDQPTTGVLRVRMEYVDLMTSPPASPDGKEATGGKSGTKVAGGKAKRQRSVACIMLRAHIINASNLPNIDSLGKSEPYVTAVFQGVKNKTSVKKGEINPEWDEKLEWELTGKPPPPDEKLEFLIKNHGTSSKNRMLGKTTILLENVMSSGQDSQELELPLVDGNDQPTRGVLRVRMEYVDLTTSPPVTPEGKETARWKFGTKVAGGKIKRQYSVEGIMLRAHIISASNLSSIDGLGKSEPYVTAVFQGVKSKTSVKKGETDPEWDEKLEWELTGKPPSPDEKLEFLIKNHGKASKNRLLGKTTILHQHVMSSGQNSQELELPLVDGNDQPTTGVLRVRMEYVDLATSPPASPEGNEATGWKFGTKVAGGKTKRQRSVEGMMLRAHIIDASNLPNIDSLGKSEPYVTAVFQGVKNKTSVKKGETNPAWDEKLEWELTGKPPSPDQKLEFLIKNHGTASKNRLLGKATVLLENVMSSGQNSTELELPLVDGSDQPTTGLLRVRMEYLDLATLPPDSPDGKEATGGKSGTKVPGDKTKRQRSVENMMLRANIIDASNLPNIDILGKSEPYVTAVFQGVKNKTSVKKGEINPAWDEKLEWELTGIPSPPDDKLEFLIKNHGTTSKNRLLGKATILLQNVMGSGQNSNELDLPIVDGDDQPTRGLLRVRMEYVDLTASPPASPNGKGVAGGKLGTGGKTRTISSPQAIQATSSGDIGMGQAAEYHPDTVDGRARKEAINSSQAIQTTSSGNIGMSQGAEYHPAMSSHEAIEATSSGVIVTSQGAEYHAALEGMGVGPRNRDLLPDKKTKFQVRVKVVEARGLIGGDLKPTCRVSLGNDSKSTRVQKATNNPWFDELFFYYLKKLPSEVWDATLEFRVCNSRMLRSNVVLGVFKLDLGAVYDQPMHAFVNKWLALTPLDEEARGVVGFLKVSIAILGPNDDCPDLKVSGTSDEEDVESNMLFPAGLKLSPAAFHLDIFQAEDLPRVDTKAMSAVKKAVRLGDASSKQLVDSFIIFSFAGKQVQTSVVHKSDRPEFKQRLHLGFLFPAFADQLKLELKDCDRKSDSDSIGTALLPLPSISAAGEDSFLPTFGPCFVNFYGSTGKGDDCAYRGRCLVGLRTSVGQSPNVASEPIDPEEEPNTHWHLRRKKYLLHCAFEEATMVSEVDKPVEFEVSMGNFGSKFQDSVMPSSSTTQPISAVFDGCQYYFLPWEGPKPCVTVHCQWEDISHRLHTLNMLLMTAMSLEKSLSSLRTSIQAGKGKKQLMKEFGEACDQLLRNCRIPLPTPEPHVQSSNQLDGLLYGRRCAKMNSIIKGVLELKETAADLEEAAEQLEMFATTLRDLAVEPQNSMPDVIIWMLSGKKRLAYCRISAHTILFAGDERQSGADCGRLQTIQLNFSGTKNKSCKIPALLRVRLWLGQEEKIMAWIAGHRDAETVLYAETYENQASMTGHWVTKGPTMNRPKWSNAVGDMVLPRESFVAPKDWRFDGDWFVDPEPGYQKMAVEQSSFLEDVFENESRLPTGGWTPAPTPWTDVRGDRSQSRDIIALPKGWRWSHDWRVDLNHAVDEQGWEYCVEATLGSYGPVDKPYHRYRRRRWVRPRTLIEEVAAEETVTEQEGWEYAPRFGVKFHARKRKVDMVRRRRWHRKLHPSTEGVKKLPVFRLKDSDSEGALNCPKMYLVHTMEQQYQLRAYIYQARDLLAGDKTGFSDPFAFVSFLNVSQRTELAKATLCPTWDQTLLYDDLTIHGDPLSILEQPPLVVVEVFDHDANGEPEFLGRAVATPTVHLDPRKAKPPPLKWYPFTKGDKADAGELLASFELFCKTTELPFLPPTKKGGSLYYVPSGIRPVLQRTAVEILCWGVRNMKNFELRSVRNPAIEFECAGKIVTSEVLKDLKQHPNFCDPLLFMDIMLPKEPLYMPPLNIKVRDHRSFGSRPMVGTHVVRSLIEYSIEPLMDVKSKPVQGRPQAADIKTGSKKAVAQGDATHSQAGDCAKNMDWWSKYYSSAGELKKCGDYLSRGYEKLEIYPVELERVACFDHFQDILNTMPILRGKSSEDEESATVGEFIGTMKVYTLPDDPSVPLPPRQIRGIPPSAPEEVTVRVYIVRGFDLSPQDSNGLSDPYLVVQLGKHRKDTRDSYRPKTLNPIFGSFIELSCTLPKEKDLTVSVMDYDLISKDDLIGETKIDLENRYLTKYRATCGIPREYHLSGPNQWRDTLKPRKILKKVCEINNQPQPLWLSKTEVVIGSKHYRLSELEDRSAARPSSLGPDDERLALLVLHTFELVPEHVETRRLFNPAMPEHEQGRLEMMVDIFPKSAGPPGPPFDITPREPSKYQLRVVLYNVLEVVLQEYSVVAQKHMSDVYVKCWIQGDKNVQKTDVHYRCMDGVAMFNWRFVFDLEYLEVEQMLVIKSKDHLLSLAEREEHRPPKLMFQIWDNDLISKDDYIGEIELDLNRLLCPARTARHCGLAQLDSAQAEDTANDNSGKPASASTLRRRKTEELSQGPVDIWTKKRLKGFWPTAGEVDGKRVCTGKLEMEMEVLTAEEAKERPAGKARDEPNKNPTLSKPNRPESSFLWLKSPWKSFKHIIWRRYKWYLLIPLIILLLVLFLFFSFFFLR